VAATPATPTVARRLALERAARAWLARHAHRETEAALGFDLTAWDRAAPELAAEVLARAVATVGGATYPPGRGRVAMVVRRLQAGPCRLTLGGAILGRAGARLVVAPENATSSVVSVRDVNRPALVGAPFDASHVVADGAMLIC
jgi:hypothetical protein